MLPPAARKTFTELMKTRLRRPRREGQGRPGGADLTHARSSCPSAWTNPKMKATIKSSANPVSLQYDSPLSARPRALRHLVNPVLNRSGEQACLPFVAAWSPQSYRAVPPAYGRHGSPPSKLRYRNESPRRKHDNLVASGSQNRPGTSACCDASVSTRSGLCSNCVSVFSGGIENLCP